MMLFWVGTVLVVALVSLASITVAVYVWRRSLLRKTEASLVQLQDELARVNSLLEETRARIQDCGVRIVDCGLKVESCAPGEQSAGAQREKEE